MILYLLKSTLCMAVFIIFYKWTVEDVTMHKFKRGYLLIVLILSFLIPFSPTGYNYVSHAPLIEEEISSTSFTEVNINQQIIEPVSTLSIQYLLSIIFLVISGLLFIRFFKNIRLLTRKASINQKIRYHATQLVLTEENEVPHTFLDKIYINKEEYLNGQIPEQLLVHERAHADQRHSWDIIFIEVLICIFWFNPILRIYKTAIQLNHEFLADETVINQYQQVKQYQYLLLDTIKNNNQISLASSINFSLTKKRLEMMTHKSTARKKNLLILSILPLVLILLVALGSPLYAQSIPEKQAIKNQKMDAFFKDASIHYIGKDGLEYVKKYHTIPDYIKNQLVLPPPPPSSPNRKQNGKATNPSPLKKGTIVTLNENGSIHIGGKGDDLSPPPPPPAPPKAPSKPNNIGAPPPPPAAPVPPKSPKKIKDLGEHEVVTYRNGKKIFPKAGMTLYGDSMMFKTEVDGSQTLYIIDKD